MQMHKLPSSGSSGLLSFFDQLQHDRLCCLDCSWRNALLRLFIIISF